MHCLKRLCDPLAVESRLGSQRPPTHLHTVINCVHTLWQLALVCCILILLSLLLFQHILSSSLPFSHTQRSYNIDTCAAKLQRLMSDLSQTDTAAILWWRNHISGCFWSNPENYPSVYKLLSVQLSTENIYYVKYVTSSSMNTLWLVISFNQTYVCKTKALVSGSQPFWLAVIRLQLLWFHQRYTVETVNTH